MYMYIVYVYMYIDIYRGDMLQKYIYLFQLYCQKVGY